MFFLPSLGGGGAEMNAVRVGNALARAGEQVSLVAARAGGGYRGRVAAGVRVVDLFDRSLLSSSTLSVVRCLGPLRRVVRRERPDVLVPVMDACSIVALLALGRSRPGRPMIALSLQN